MRRGFTLIELMVVVAIIAIIGVVGGITLSSRMATSRLEGAARSLAADLAYARTAALFKGCHMRFILCRDARCTDRVLTERVNGYLGTDAGLARYYAILRRAQYTDVSQPCYFEGTDPSSGADGFYDQWDFDRKPQALPQGVAFSAIYTGEGGSLDVSDWSDTSSSEAGNSLYFHASPNALTPMVFPVEYSNMPDNLGRAVFQLGLEDCSPTNPSDDCTAYIISMTSGGEVSVIQCEPGVREDGTRTCY